MMKLLLAVPLAFGIVVSSGSVHQAAPARPRTAERADLVVAQDGSGDTRTIQAALDRLPANNATNKIVLVRNGTYPEKLLITASHVSIVGEDRARTRIEFPELRRVWRESHPDD